ncbi:hypothetical protein [Streptomyces olivaceiscleroticus]|uniref:Uncharacterized protein n=1 Tax=Streptomyces olivaceiscleroticus TaxID=68245 RepID=A0ABP3LHA2_9ACTN
MTVSLCKHGFIVLPPHGSIFRPGPCTDCGMTYEAREAELREQEEALILGTSHDGTCPDCKHTRRLFRYQPQEQPWHEIGTELPVAFLCLDCYNAAADAENALIDSLFAS